MVTGHSSMSTTSERKMGKVFIMKFGSEFEYSGELAIQFKQRDELNNELEIQVTFRVEYECDYRGEYVFSKFKGCIYSEFYIQHGK